MATRSRSTFKKRQKELARMEKQRDKAAKRVQRKLEKTTLGTQTDEIAGDELYGGVDDYEPENEPENETENETETPDAPKDSSDPR